MSKAGVLIAGFILGLVTVGFAGIVAANNFSGPSSEPPNGTVSPVFDGLTVRGDFRVEPSGGDTVSMKDLFVDGLGTNTIRGAFPCTSMAGCNGDQYLRLVSGDIELSAADELRIKVAGSNPISMTGHVIATSIGGVYQRQSNIQLQDNYAGKNNYTYATCGSNAMLVSCTAYVYGDTNASFSYQGSMGYTSACYGYARQIKDTTNTSSRLYVTANCWDPSIR